MRSLYLASILCASAFPLRAQNQYMQQYLDSMRETNRTIERSADRQINQQVANEYRRHNLAEEGLQRDELRERYRQSHDNAADWRINQDVKTAFATCRMAHEDCDKLGWIMKIVADSFTPNWQRVTMSEYVEALYVIAKNASFAATAREVALKMEPAAKPAR